MTKSELTTGAILSRTNELLRGDARHAITAVAVLAAIGVVLDAISRGGAGGNTAQGAIGIFMQYSIVSGLLGELGLMPDGYRARPFWRMLGLSLLSTLAIVLGLIVLMAPGIVLAVRWSIAVPVLVAEEVGVIAAMGASWRATKGVFWPILGAFVAIYVPFLLVMLVGGAGLAMAGPAFAIGISIIVNIVIYAAVVAGCWYASVAIYAAIGEGQGHLNVLSETFA